MAPLYHSLLTSINAAIVEAADTDFRKHLGGSLIGKECDRAIWYGFRWAHKEQFDARMLRLFERGHLEEFRFTKHLRSAGVVVQEYSQALARDRVTGVYCAVDWDDENLDLSDNVTGDPAHHAAAQQDGVQLKQWRISGVRGHFGGSLDGIGHNFPDMDPERKGLLEFKTHNTKSFVQLVNNGVKIAKPEHWSQMQVYMHNKDLPFAVYVAVNKNDDDLYPEIVERDPKEGERLMARAERIIDAPQPPSRISNSPAWMSCKFCTYSKICHYAEPMLKNCRTCQHSKPVDDGQWFCSAWNNLIPVDFVVKGCENHKEITD